MPVKRSKRGDYVARLSSDIGCNAHVEESRNIAIHQSSDLAWVVHPPPNIGGRGGQQEARHPRTELRRHAS